LLIHFHHVDGTESNKHVHKTGAQATLGQLFKSAISGRKLYIPALNSRYPKENDSRANHHVKNVDSTIRSHESAWSSSAWFIREKAPCLGTCSTYICIRGERESPPGLISTLTTDFSLNLFSFFHRGKIRRY